MPVLADITRRELIFGYFEDDVLRGVTAELLQFTEHDGERRSLHRDELPTSLKQEIPGGGVREGDGGWGGWRAGWVGARLEVGGRM